ncbi:MAG: hypothetical protein NTX96_02870, partial [Candidatus Zambryskibacteria bacterium]|nr:hypothetical protein [Candidatus Zambryskibacteria bacterium]
VIAEHNRQKGCGNKEESLLNEIITRELGLYGFVAPDDIFSMTRKVTREIEKIRSGEERKRPHNLTV